VRAGRTDRKTTRDIAILLQIGNFNSASKQYHKESQAGIAPIYSFRAVDGMLHEKSASFEAARRGQ
jgi:hypothetical protein